MIGADCATPAGAAEQAFTPRRLTARPAGKRASLAAINHTALLGKWQQSMLKQPSFKIINSCF
ncbi:hypothetical protein E6W99_13110 [Metabacillus sediminilitoris]|uniref:Uncharacterized protein n=1 Tax=Metabacillus sediminilitoris TaxID=2567941 RepID=A0A4S4BVZ0_9BACI|nr:hypothetical protein E6W99_13110 [Metabacillus sediminilitoris]